jgi:hypothetical protein
MINYRLIEQREETKVRRWLLEYDDELALHSQLKNYFLSGSPTAGIAVVEKDGEYDALCFFSCYDQALHIHNWFNGNSTQLDSLIDKVPEFSTVVTVNAFFIKQYVPGENWTKQFDVTPGFVVDHSAYSGVFSRSAPRALGGVYEKQLRS